MLRNLDWLHDLDVQYDASTFDTDPFEPQPDGRHTMFPFRVPRPNDNCPIALQSMRSRAARGVNGSPTYLGLDPDCGHVFGTMDDGR